MVCPLSHLFIYEEMILVRLIKSSQDSKSSQNSKPALIFLDIAAGFSPYFAIIFFCFWETWQTSLIQ